MGNVRSNNISQEDHRSVLSGAPRLRDDDNVYEETCFMSETSSIFGIGPVKRGASKKNDKKKESPKKKEERSSSKNEQKEQAEKVEQKKKTSAKRRRPSRPAAEAADSADAESRPQRRRPQRRRRKNVKDPETIQAQTAEKRKKAQEKAEAEEKSEASRPAKAAKKDGESAKTRGRAKTNRRTAKSSSPSPQKPSQPKKSLSKGPHAGEGLDEGVAHYDPAALGLNFDDDTQDEQEERESKTRRPRRRRSRKTAPAAEGAQFAEQREAAQQTDEEKPKKKRTRRSPRRSKKEQERRAEARVAQDAGVQDAPESQSEDSRESSEPVLNEQKSLAAGEREEQAVLESQPVPALEEESTASEEAAPFETSLERSFDQMAEAAETVGAEPKAEAPVEPEVSTGEDSQDAAAESAPEEHAEAPQSDAVSEEEAAPEAPAAEKAPAPEKEHSHEVKEVPEDEALPELSFEELPEDLREACLRAGWTTLMPVQAKAIPYLLAGRDLMIQSRTGSGKTGCFALPIMQRIEIERAECQALVLVPTRELAQQVAEQFEQLFGETGARVVAVFGGSSYKAQIDSFRKGAHVVVGTPGRVLDHLLRGSLNLKGIDTLVFDEADRMLSIGFYPDMKEVQSFLPRRDISMLMTSATYPPHVLRLAGEFMDRPQILSLSSEQVHLTETPHVYYSCPAMQKDRALVRIIELENPATGFIFCNTKQHVHYLTTVLQRFGYDADELSGDLTQSKRERVLTRMRSGNLRFLVTTDVAARGIDIPDISHVFMYEPPEDHEVYIHRAGRTGRAGASGMVISLVDVMERLALGRIAKTYGINLEQHELPTDEDLALEVGNRVTAMLEARFRELDNVKQERLRRFEPLVDSLSKHEDLVPLMAMLLDELYQESLHGTPALPQVEQEEATPQPESRRSSQGGQQKRRSSGNSRRRKRRPESSGQDQRQRHDGRRKPQGEKSSDDRSDQRKDQRSDSRKDQRRERSGDRRQNADGAKRRRPRRRRKKKPETPQN
ncbi:DEAD/DEAH box helicase [Desulfobaculum bizertense]|uniref:DEAD/DEAH box helicase n=1 Tax=Desulfobaculum bizertense TaxID=376490 RepID=UPI001F44DCC6|nr:DEAD/DEAH box helicase [Desulfobaculum bizertense]UIJ37489.1 DEAD/DEAH box helicase [Desulfobaculum bizertense]